MLVRGRATTALCLSVISYLFTPAIAKHREPAPRETASIAADAAQSGSTRPAAVTPAAALTCDPHVIDPLSYDMAINAHISTLRDLNLDAQDLAERALERDRRNLMAHSILARQYAIAGWEREAADAWSRVFDSGGVVVWTATLYDVDYKSVFLMAFGREAVRIYTMGQFTAAIDRRLGYAKFPEPTEVAFYEAAAGCPGPSVQPMATIPWSRVTELRSGNWVLWFKLAQPVALTSDRGQKKTVREIKVNLHGATGDVKILAEPNPDFDPAWDDESAAFKNVRGIGLGPWDYNRRMRDMILRFAEPGAHIKRSSAGKGAGW